MMIFSVAHRHYQGLILLLLGLLASCRSERVALQFGPAQGVYSSETPGRANNILPPATAHAGRFSTASLPTTSRPLRPTPRKINRISLPASSTRLVVRQRKLPRLHHHFLRKTPVASHSPAEYRYPPDFLAVPIATTGASIALLVLYLTLGSSVFFTLSVLLGILSVLLLAVVIILYAIGGSGHKLGG
ncbi:hypothetical protein Q5H93_11190 [Hymenobacter sp. ASUV-10]|uniref:Uncharacterized protein n=1 Tax=Hymenobacter aranciens TaxID=3063996 RepID=A0ABT9BAJ9_9BACT|nr:hypothetical protein [Hymenobacter sp. ASUV-10]MDO7875299.1 hypothetical protein [Hymenobacter sp. ASUV-10]